MVNLGNNWYLGQTVLCLGWGWGVLCRRRFSVLPTVHTAKRVRRHRPATLGPKPVPLENCRCEGFKTCRRGCHLRHRFGPGGPGDASCVPQAWTLSQWRGSASLHPSARLSPRANSTQRRTQEGTAASPPSTLCVSENMLEVLLVVSMMVQLEFHWGGNVHHCQSNRGEIVPPLAVFLCPGPAGQTDIHPNLCLPAWAVLLRVLGSALCKCFALHFREKPTGKWFLRFRDVQETHQ